MKSQKKVKTVLLLATLMLSTMLIAGSAYADESDYEFPTSYAIGSTGNAPLYPEQALTDELTPPAANNSVCAWFKGTLGAPDSEYYLGFVFDDIPDGSTIDGVEVIVSGYRAGDAVTGATFSVSIDAGVGGTAYKQTSALTKNSDGNYTLGAYNDDWGLMTTWISDASFKLEIKASTSQHLNLWV